LSATGGAETTHTLKISEIANQIYPDSAYYSSRHVATTGYSVDDIELPVLRTDTINDIVLNIPITFGEYLIRDATQLFYSNTKADFRAFFKGLYFQMKSSANPTLISLSVAQPATLGGYYNYFVVFLSNAAGSKSQYTFILDASNKNAAFNKFSHNFNTVTPDKKIQHINDNYKDTLSYLQCLNGVYTKIKMPGLETLKNSTDFKNVQVNKARLSVPVKLDGSTYMISTIPSGLLLRYRTKSGIKYYVPDYGVDTYHYFFNGSIDTTAHVYNFNIPAFVQGYLEDATGEVLPELEIFQTSGLHNVILKANKNNTPVKFLFTYTKF
jgi:hypothetical protein